MVVTLDAEVVCVCKHDSVLRLVWEQAVLPGGQYPPVAAVESTCCVQMGVKSNC